MPSSSSSSEETEIVDSMEMRPCTEEGGSYPSKEIASIIKSRTEDSPFVKSNPPKLLPIFGLNEIDVGKVLGKGQFGTVREVSQIRQDRSLSFKELLHSELSVRNLGIPKAECDNNNSNNNNNRSSSRGKNNNKNENNNDNNNNNNDNNQALKLSNYYQSASCEMRSIDEARMVLRLRCRRDGQARYAVKRLRDDLNDKAQFSGIIDMATEAMFLSSLSHPNIVTLRATVGVPGHADFMLMLDRLYSTLHDQIKVWKKEKRRSKIALRGRKDLQRQLFIQRLYTAYDIARALGFLHEHNIIYRDLKPENIGYDIRGDIRIFDFGLAREVTEECLKSPPEDYELTGATGSPRWMAPEVHLYQPYGPSCDVYSFGLLFWNIFSLKTPFGQVTRDEHFQRVIMGGKRPGRLDCLSPLLRNMMTTCWSPNRSERPSFQRVCTTIKNQIEDTEESSIDRTVELMGKSRQSFIAWKSTIPNLE